MKVQSSVANNNLVTANPSSIFVQNRERQDNVRANEVAPQPLGNEVQTDPATGEVFSMMIFSILMGLALSFLTIGLKNSKTNGEIIKHKPFKKLPCHSCKFFNKNPYLKCAVRPNIALTKEANNCQDYQSQ
jgi:hypothetical protein